jgi:hypothetical protein
MLDVAEIIKNSHSHLTPQSIRRLADRETGSIWKRWDWEIYN